MKLLNIKPHIKRENYNTKRCTHKILKLTSNHNFNNTIVLHRFADFKVNYFSLFFNISYGVFPLNGP